MFCYGEPFEHRTFAKGKVTNESLYISSNGSIKVQIALLHVVSFKIEFYGT